MHQKLCFSSAASCKNIVGASQKIFCPFYFVTALVQDLYVGLEASRLGYQKYIATLTTDQKCILTLFFWISPTEIIKKRRKRISKNKEMMSFLFKKNIGVQEQKNSKKNMNSIEIGKYRHLARLQKKQKKKNTAPIIFPEKMALHCAYE